MAIRDERTSTEEILRDARFHRAALKGNPLTHSLAERSQATETALKAKKQIADDREDARTDALAMLTRGDFELDESCRVAELDLLGAVRKNRDSADYQACFPRSLTELISGRGREQADGVKTLVENLRKRLPDLGARHGEDLSRLAEAVVTAEQSWIEAERQAAAAFGEERIARIELVRQLQKNEGALAELFPGQRRRVRSFFRPTRRRGAAGPQGGPDATPPTA